MRRQRLRTQTGCRRCRIRKKKCDETKPICGDCSRLHFQCTWDVRTFRIPQDDTGLPVEVQTYLHEAKHLVKHIPLSLDSCPHEKFFENQSHYDLTSAWVGFITKSIAPYVKPQNSGLSAMVPLVLKNMVSSNAVASIIAYALYTISGEASFQVRCLEAYKRSTNAMRKLDWDNLRDDEIAMLPIAGNTLGIVESTLFGHPDNTVKHLTMSALLWAKSVALLRSSEDNVGMLRLTCEGFLFYLSVSSTFFLHSQMRHVFNCLDWELIESMYKPPLGFSNMDIQYSVHHGIQHGIYRLILQLTYVARVGASNRVVLSEESCYEQLQALEEQQRQFYAPLSNEVAIDFLPMSTLFLICLRIYARKVFHPHVCSSDALIQTLVAQARRILCDELARGAVTGNYFWQLCVLASAVRLSTDFESLTKADRSFKLNMGFARLWNHVKTTVRQARMNEPCSDVTDCHSDHDGLEFLYSGFDISTTPGSLYNEAYDRSKARVPVWLRRGNNMNT